MQVSIPHQGNTIYDVIVIGSGATGLGCALSLKKFGINNFIVIADQENNLDLSSHAKFISALPIENSTRLTQRNGHDAWKSYLEISKRGLDEILKFSNKNGIAAIKGPIHRLSTSRHECDEIYKSNQIWQSLGIPSKLENKFLYNSSNRTVQVHDDCLLRSNVHRIMETAKLEIFEHLHCHEVVQIETSKEFATVRTKDNKSFKSEIIVLANGLGISKLMPEMADKLIPYQDQWNKFKFNTSPFEIGDWFLIFAQYSLFTLFNDSNESLWICGGRFKRKFEGIGSSTPSLCSRSLQACHSFAQKFLKLEKLEHLCSIALNDINTCDELPIIGPMYGQERILLATGYAGAGIAVGFGAGSCLADLIASGKCLQLDQSLQPSRFQLPD